MKKVLLTLFVALALVACKGKDGIDGKDGKDGLVNVAVIDLEVKANGWQYANQNQDNYFMANFDMPEITNYIYDNGLVQVYREFGTNTANAIQQVLPCTRHHEWLDEVNNTWNFYTETIDYEYGVGFLNIFYTASDFAYETETTPTKPEDMHFRVQIMW